MRVYRISNIRYSDHLSGEGAFRVGGRWNSKRVRMVYTSTSIALASLEVLVHTDGLPIQKGMILLTFDIPDDLVSEAKDLPTDWDRIPPNHKSKIVGDKFINDKLHLALAVPSAIIPEEKNILINPMHINMSKVEIVNERPFAFDGRL